MTTLTRESLSLSHIREINQLLARWNPLEVPNGIAPSEYLTYAEHLANATYTVFQTEDYLFHLLEEWTGLTKTDLNDEQRQELTALVHQIHRITCKTC